VSGLECHFMFNILNSSFTETVISDMAEESSTFGHIRYGTCLGVRRQCCGDVRLVPSKIWENLTELAHHIIICWQDGKLLSCFVD
jgi:hypothetical protein